MRRFYGSPAVGFGREWVLLASRLASAAPGLGGGAPGTVGRAHPFHPAERSPTAGAARCSRSDGAAMQPVRRGGDAAGPAGQRPCGCRQATERPVDRCGRAAGCRSARATLRPAGTCGRTAALRPVGRWGRRTGAAGQRPYGCRQATGRPVDGRGGAAGCRSARVTLRPAGACGRTAAGRPVGRCDRTAAWRPASRWGRLAGAAGQRPCGCRQATQQPVDGCGGTTTVWVPPGGGAAGWGRRAGAVKGPGLPAAHRLQDTVPESSIAVTRTARSAMPRARPR